MDVLKKYLAHNDMVRVTVVDATDLVQQARDIHLLSNVATAALGRTLIASLMVASNFKENDNKLTVQIKGDGPLKSIIVCSDNTLNIKGYVSVPDVLLPLNKIGKLDVAKAVGKGTLTVIKDIGLKEPYIGTCELVSSEIAEDFAYYFVTSEQTPCAIALGVNIGTDNKVTKAAGYMVEPLPNCSDEIIDTLEVVNNSISSVTNLMIDLGDILDVAKTVAVDNEVKEIYSKEPKYKCDCNEERIKRAIISLGKKDAIEALRNNNNVLELSCSFCNKCYRYNEKEVLDMFD